jgi:hypothetical protein
MDNKTYYVDCTGNQALRDELLDYAVQRGAEEMYLPRIDDRTHAWLSMKYKAVFASAGCPTLITPATWKRKVRKIWGGTKPKKAAAKKPVNAKDIHPTTLKALNMHSNARHSVLRDGLTAMEGRIMDHIEEVRAMITKVESSVAVIRSGASFMQQLEKEVRIGNDLGTTDAPIGLQSGDYCDASKEVADALTAMDFKWHDDDRARTDVYQFIQWIGKKNTCLTKNTMVNCRLYNRSQYTHLTPSEFLRRAAVTAKELGLQPVVEEPLKAGDLVEVIGSTIEGNQRDPIGSIHQVGDGRISNDKVGIGLWWYPRTSLRKLSDAEVAAYHEAKELGLQPVVELHIGDYVKNKRTGTVSQITDVHNGNIAINGVDVFRSAEEYCLATDLEVTAYHAAKQEQERKDKEGRLVFGQAVEYQDDRGWKVATDKPFSANTYLITKTGHARLEWARIDELTIIDP